jgi:hypothetical protein
MPAASDDPLETLLRTQRRAASARHDDLGPLVAAAGLIRTYAATTRELLDLLETDVAFHLEILNHLLIATHGSQWWQELSNHDRGNA